jgi:tetratricopeptide (TPR) repeat protein
MKRTILLALAVLGLAAARLGADIITLDDGRKFEGQAVTEGDQVKVITKMGTLTFAKDKVVKIEKVSGPADAYKEKAAAIKDGDAEAHYQLAMWCKENRLVKEMTQELNKVVAIDPEHEKARLALDYVKVEGKWVKTQPGMVYFGGEWIKPEDAVTRAKDLYKVAKYEEAAKAFAGASVAIHKDSALAEVEMGLALCAERLGQWDDAKSAYDTVLKMKPDALQRPEAEARRQIIDGSTGGMYLVKDYAGKEDIFSIDTDKKEKIKKLAGLQPLTNPDVMDIALREKCAAYAEKGKGLLKQAKDANTGTPDGDKKAEDLIRQAEDEFGKANRLVKDVSRGFLIECTKLRIAVVAKPFDTKWAAVQGRVARLNAVTDGKEKMQIAGSILRELDDLGKPLDTIQKLAGQYPDELAQQLGQCKTLRDTIDRLKATLRGFIGK